MLELLAFHSNNAALALKAIRAAGDSKVLGKDDMNALGLKGSPKLSKVLVGLGVPTKMVELGLSAPSQKGIWVVGEHLDDVDLFWEQGDSKHYKSCQRSDQDNDELFQVPGDIPYACEDLFMWVAGQPFSWDGEGFKARAKLRVMYKDRSCTEIAGLYIDRMYGQISTLINDLDRLQLWWNEFQVKLGAHGTPILVPPVFGKDEGAGQDLEGMYGNEGTPYYCRSAQDGYQDTLTRGVGPYTFMTPYVKEPSLRRAYKARHKEGGVWHCAMRDMVWHSQKALLVMPEVPKDRSADRDLWKKALSFLPRPQKVSFDDNIMTFTSEGHKYQLIHVGHFITVKAQTGGRWKTFFIVKPDGITIVRPLLGFVSPSLYEYDYVDYDDPAFEVEFLD